MSSYPLVSALVALVVLVLVSAAADANGKHSPRKKGKSKQMEYGQAVGQEWPKFEAARKQLSGRVVAARRDMDNLARNIEENQRNGNTWVGKRGTHEAVSNAINTHGKAVKDYEAFVGRKFDGWLADRNIVIIPDAPRTPPPPLPPARLQPPANPAPPPTLVDARPAKGKARVRFADNLPSRR